MSMFGDSVIKFTGWPGITNVGRQRGPRAAFIADADRWADLWEADRPALYMSTSSDGRMRGIPPWERYDRYAMPLLAVWPWMDRAVSAWHKVRRIPTEACYRVRAAAFVLRYGEEAT